MWILWVIIGALVFFYITKKIVGWSDSDNKWYRNSRPTQKNKFEGASTSSIVLHKSNSNLNNLNISKIAGVPKQDELQHIKKSTSKDDEVITISEKTTIKADQYTGDLIDYRIVQGQLDGHELVAEIPYKIKEKCDKMIRNTEGSFYDAEFMHDNYWVIVWFKGVRHAYKGTDDIWTYSARELPELPVIHNWIYSILNVSKPSFRSDEIVLVEKWVDEVNHLWCRGVVKDLHIEFTCSLRGNVTKYVLKDKARFRDKAIYSAKRKEFNFPFFYSECQNAIMNWSDELVANAKIEFKK